VPAPESSDILRSPENTFPVEHPSSQLRLPPYYKRGVRCVHTHTFMHRRVQYVIHAQHTAHRRCTPGQCSPRPTPLPLGGHRRCARHKHLATSFSIFNPRHLPICNLKSSRPSRLSPRCSHARTIFRPKWKPPYMPSRPLSRSPHLACQVRMRGCNQLRRSPRFLLSVHGGQSRSI